ncbi:hypothetical protein M422DRAFT_34665 [Sphaerobolus stellatus SS14]|uniref:Uncharacterized protein n=1 Tax=Sphaerobolus stellatus (strain SS14) TaxID=990650 RepID=A0A0C9V1D0_SPHS4|nr:hypothetical protein M422DRAFT_34665 [Sphaerobolus stellatus SS14]
MPVLPTSLQKSFLITKPTQPLNIPIQPRQHLPTSRTNRTSYMSKQSFRQVDANWKCLW